MADLHVQILLDAIGKTRNTDRLQVEVNLRYTVCSNGIQNRFQTWPHERPRENANRHFCQALTTGPVTPTRWPQFTDSSTASSRLTAAQPSPASGLVGRSSRTARAKASS